MRYITVRKICLFGLFFTGLGLPAFSQLNHYIYLQTDNQQPFYIKYNNRIYSSSSSGYLILSKLKDGMVDFSVGFPKSNQQEHKFQCPLENADKGYLIKNFAAKGWGLYDLQSSAIIYTGTVTDTKTINPVVTTAQPAADDPFANMLSKVTQDSTVKNVTVRKEEKAVIDTPKPVVATYPVVTQAQLNDSIKIIAVQQPVQVVEPLVTEPAWVMPSKSSIQQIRKVDSREGSDFVFEVVNTNGVKDTVRLFIAKDTLVGQSVQPPASIPEVKIDTIAVIKEEKKEPQAQTIVKKEVQQKEEVKPSVVAEQKAQQKSLPNSNCTSSANEDDFMKLRKKMAGESKDEAMINAAKKVFRTKCFSTGQIKNLAVLFLNDEGRYRFYDAAMIYITDFSNFKNLGETIQDDYYKKRFSALLPNQ